MATRKSASRVLTDAVWAGDIKAARKLVADGHSVDERDPLGKTALMIAVLNASAKVARLFLRLGADPNCLDERGRSALHFAAEEHSVPLARLLLDAGADVDRQDAEGNTPLWNALYYSIGRDSELQFVRLLLKHGADPDRKNKKGVSPLELRDNSGHFAKLTKCLAQSKLKVYPPRRASLRPSKDK